MYANNPLRIRLPPFDSVQHGNIRPPAPRMDWECPMCGMKFSQEATKDRHMTSCGYADNSIPQQPIKVLMQNQRHTSCPQIVTHATQRLPRYPVTESKQRVFISIRLQQPHNEQVTYTSGAGERTSLVWDSNRSCFLAQADLSLGEHTGTIHIYSTNTVKNVNPFQVNHTPDSLPSVEIYCQDSGANNTSKSKPPVKPRPKSLISEEGEKHLQLLTPGIVFGQIGKVKTDPHTVKESRYEDGEIYANVGQLAENIRLKHELEQCQASSRRLEEENLALKEDIEKKNRIIDSFQIKNKDLESKVAELMKLGKFENKHIPGPPIATQRKPQVFPPSRGPRPPPLSPSKEANN